jgi:hypothetical protein
MKLKTTLIALSVCASLMSHPAIAERVGTGAKPPTPVASPSELKFANERQFLEKFGQHAVKLGNGSYRLERGDTTFDVSFGAAAIKSAQREVGAQLNYLHTLKASELTPAQAGDIIRLELRQQQLSMRLQALNTQAKGFDDDSLDQCGFDVYLVAETGRTFADGFAQATATVSPGNSVAYTKGWHASMELSAFAAQPNFQGGLFNPVYDLVSHDTYNNTVSPPRPAYAYTPGFYVCLRASGFAEVTKSSGNPFFPNYCGNPISVVATTNDPECPSY